MNKSIAFNTRFLTYVSAFGSILVFLAILTEGNHNGKLVVIYALFYALLSLTEPNYYVADEEGIAICFFIFVRCYYKWEEIEKIKEVLASGYKKERYKAYFLIAPNKKSSFFDPGIITKSSATKRLIKMYWKNKIIDDEDIDYEIELKKKKRKLMISNEKLLIKSEGETRTKIDDIIKDYKIKAKQHNKFIKAKYVYNTDNKTYKERPDYSYSFALNIEVGKVSESEDKSVSNVIKLLTVTRGENKNKLTENKNAVSEIKKLLNEAIEK